MYTLFHFTVLRTAHVACSAFALCLPRHGCGPQYSNQAKQAEQVYDARVRLRAEQMPNTVTTDQRLQMPIAVANVNGLEI